MQVGDELARTRHEPKPAQIGMVWELRDCSLDSVIQVERGRRIGIRNYTAL